MARFVLPGKSILWHIQLEHGGPHRCCGNRSGQRTPHSLLNSEANDNARKLLYVLRVERGNGFDTWRQLVWSDTTKGTRSRWLNRGRPTGLMRSCDCRGETPTIKNLGEEVLTLRRTIDELHKRLKRQWPRKEVARLRD